MSEAGLFGQMARKVSLKMKWEASFVEEQSGSHNDTACLQKWMKAVKAYVRANFTFESDKLVAMYGIARHFKDTTWR